MCVCLFVCCSCAVSVLWLLCVLVACCAGVRVLYVCVIVFVRCCSVVCVCFVLFVRVCALFSMFVIVSLVGVVMFVSLLMCSHFCVFGVCVLCCCMSLLCV